MARSRNEIVELGRHYQGAKLLEQTGYTERIAREDLAALGPFGIGETTLSEVNELRRKVEASLSDRTLAAEEAKSATRRQDESVGDAKSWLRQAILIARNACEGAPERVEAFVRGARTGSSLPKLAERMRRVLDLIEQDASVARFGADAAFQKLGRDILAALTDADTDQESKRAKLPAVTEAFYHDKGMLYLALKRINRAGKAAHVRDPVRAAAYSLSIVHRRGAKRGAKEEAPAPTA